MTAPDFSGSHPSAGERIGPAWQLAWEKLTEGNWMVSDELASLMCGNIDIKWKTAKNLLREARKAGLLESERRSIKGRRRVLYRLLDLSLPPLTQRAHSPEERAP